MAPNKRTRSRYPGHIDHTKLPANVGYDPRGRGRWVYRDRKLGLEIRLGSGEMRLSDLWSAVDALDRGTVPTLRTISEIFQKSPDWKKLAPPTQKDYKNCHDAVCDRVTKAGSKAGELPIEAWTRPVITRWMDARAIESESRMQHEFRYLKRLFRWAIRRDYIKDDPTKGSRLETSKHKTGRYVTDEELTGAIILAPVKIGLMALLAYLTGRRKGDLMRISRLQVTSEGLAFLESKTGKRTVVTWTDDLRIVVDLLGEESPDSTMIVDYNNDSFDSAWQRLRKKMKEAKMVPFKFQDLRAKHATDLDASGGDATRNLLHSTSALTQKHYLRKARKVVSIR